MSCSPVPSDPGPGQMRSRRGAAGRMLGSASVSPPAAGAPLRQILDSPSGGHPFLSANTLPVGKQQAWVLGEL